VPRVWLNQTNRHASWQRFRGEKIRFFLVRSGNADCVFPGRGPQLGEQRLKGRKTQPMRAGVQGWLPIT
jgi:hypothetical protein